MNINRALKRAVSVICTIMLCVIASYTAGSTVCAEDSSSAEITDTSKNSVEVFQDYLGGRENHVFPKDEIPIINSEACFSEKNIISETVEVEESGFYALKFSYKANTDLSENPSFSIYLDGSLPYYEASRISLPRTYQDDYSNFEQQKLTGDLIPIEKEISRYRTYYCFDTVGYYGGMLFFYLNEGSNQVTIKVLSGSFYINELSFCHYDTAPDYGTVKESLSGKKYSGGDLVFEAEDMLYKSDTSILAVNDSSSSAVSPCEPYSKLINATGGTSWEDSGQYVEWSFTVPEDGLYSIVIKYRQENNVGMNSYRRILIDGVVPYSQLEEYPFAYSSSFVKETLSFDAKPILFDLKAGEHTICMQVVIGGLSEVLPYVNKVVDTLTENYRKIIMITGTTPDSVRDYFLEQSVPDTLQSLKEQKQEIDRLHKLLDSITSGNSSASKIFGTLSNQLKEFNRDSYNITQNLASFKSNISSLCNWLLEARTQPLKLDYLIIGRENDKRPVKDGSFFGGIAFNIKAFIFTFSGDYSGNSLSSDADDTITVWVSGSATKYNVLYRLIHGDFEKKNPDIKVDLKLISSSVKLSNAIISKKNPDIALNHTATDIMNLVYRNSVVDISRFDDSKQVFSRFDETALIPVSYGGKVYAMPDTQTFSALYYRTDILSEMRLSVPKTWDDVVYVLSELKKSNLEFGIPHTLETFASMLFQAGGSIYNAAGTATELNSQESIKSFTKFTELFTDYSAPLAYNALNRFRTGEMPVLIGDLAFYNTLKVLAAEIDGRWGISLYPGTADGDKIINTQMATITGDVILNENKSEMCWKFLKWKSDIDTQLAISDGYEMSLGMSERHMSANRKAFSKLGWSSEMLNLIGNSENNLSAVPSVPGGYYLTRHIGNAISSVIYNSVTPGDAILKYSAVIDSEIKYKTEWFGLNKGK